METRDIHVNNPTQINIGAYENSSQTIGRKIGEIADDPQPAIDTTVSLVNLFWNKLFKTSFLIIRRAVVPFLICFYLAFIVIGLANGKSVIYSIIAASKLFYEFPAFLFTIIKLDDVIIFLGPWFLIAGIGSLFLFLVSYNFASYVYKNDPVRKKELTKALAVSSIAYFLYKFHKTEKK